MTSLKATHIVYTDMKMMKLIKKNIGKISLIFLSGLCCYLGVHYQILGAQKIMVTGEQIAKRTCSYAYSPYKSTQVYHGDKFYLYLDTQYGVMEIPVSYYSYINSSNEQTRSYKLSASTCLEYLENTQDFLKAYPRTDYSNTWGIIPLVLGAISALVAIAGVITWWIKGIEDGEDKKVRFWFYIWASADVLGAGLGFIL